MKTVLCSFFASISLLSQAQGPTLTSSSAPQIGDNYTMQAVYVAGISTANSGANQTWDYASVIDSGGTYSESIVNPAATPYASSFPNATIALVSSSVVDTSYGYETLTGSRLTYIGQDIDGLGSVTYTSPRVLFQYPLSYGGSYSNAFAGTSSNGDSISGIDSFTADGYGTLKIPGHTYTDVLRIKYTQHYHSFNAGFGFAEDIYQVEYGYYIPGYHNFLFDVQYSTNTVNGNSFSAMTAQYSKNITTGIDDVAESKILSVYPNPSQGAFTIHAADGAMMGAGIMVTDIAGHIIYSGKLESSAQTIDMNNSAKGMYILHLQSAYNSWYRKIMVE